MENKLRFYDKIVWITQLKSGCVYEKITSTNCLKSQANKFATLWENVNRRMEHVLPAYPE